MLLEPGFVQNVPEIGSSGITEETVIPCGPYLILGMYLVLFFGISVIELPLL